jgi:hypothetical protein
MVVYLNSMTAKYLKPLLLLAGIMLLLAIPPLWPYAYYQILRIVVTATAILGIYKAYKTGSTGWVWTLGAIAVLFNPIAPIFLTKEAWVLPDLIAAVILFLAAVKLPNRKHS